MSRRYDRTDIAKVGVWSALVALAGAVGYIVSVPLQVLDVVGPLQDSIIAFASSLIIATPFLLAMLALHYVVPEEKRFWTHAAVLMAVIYATYNTLNYVVQLATVLPAGYTWTFEDPWDLDTQPACPPVPVSAVCCCWHWRCSSP